MNTVSNSRGLNHTVVGKTEQRRPYKESRKGLNGQHGVHVHRGSACGICDKWVTGTLQLMTPDILALQGRVLVEAIESNTPADI
jgi:hypothetical protein